MNLKKGTPGKGGGPRPDSFSYTPVAFGTKNAFNGWLAGEPYWADEAHEHTDEDPGTKPCLHWLTDGALKCRRCRSAKPTKCIGWVPLYREIDTAPVIVIVHENVSDTLKGLRYGHYVLVGRVSSKSSVFVKKSESHVTMVTDKESRKRPVNIVPDLLQMWKLPDLNEWLKGSRGAVEDTSEAPFGLKQRLSVPPPTSKIEALAIDAEKKIGDSYLLDMDTLQVSIDQRRKHAEKNGHHKPNGEDQS